MPVYSWRNFSITLDFMRIFAAIWNWVPPSRVDCAGCKKIVVDYGTEVAKLVVSKIKEKKIDWIEPALSYANQKSHEMNGWL